VILVAGLANLCARAEAATPPQIHTVAGGGSCSGPMTSGGPCDGVDATSVPIGSPQSVSALPDGGYLYVDSTNDLVREVSPSGTVTTVAGTSFITQAGATVPDPLDVENVQATQSGLDDPVAVAALPAGGFLITEGVGSRVRMVNAQGIITTIAGCQPPAGRTPDQGDVPQPGDGPCPSPGTGEELNFPSDAEPTTDGGVVIADTFNCRVVEVTPGGSFTTLAGGDSGCPPTPSAASLDHPYSVSELQDGSGGVVIGEEGSGAIQEVSAGGTLSTVAGQLGSPGYSGDGGPATLAQIGPGDSAFGDEVASLPGGGFLLTDPSHEVVREVSPAGIISTIAGDGQTSNSGNNGAATAAALNNPVSVAPLPNGNVLIADQANQIIREITQPPASTITVSPATPNGLHGWYTTPPTVTVTATENATIACELDPAAAPSVFGAIQPGCPYKGSGATVAASGAHTVWASSQNSFGDQDSPVSASFNVDTGPPKITCEHEPVFPFGQPKVAVTGTLSDSVSGPSSQALSMPARTSRLGKRSVRLSGSNNAGIRAQTSCKYFVEPIALASAPHLVWAFVTSATYSAVKTLLLEDIPAGAVVGATCKGHGCSFRSRRHLKSAPCRKKCAAKGSRIANLAPMLRGRKLKPGARIAVSVTKRGTIGMYNELTVRANHAPKATSECLSAGATKPSTGASKRKCMPKLPS